MKNDARGGSRILPVFLHEDWMHTDKQGDLMNVIKNHRIGGSLRALACALAPVYGVSVAQAAPVSINIVYLAGDLAVPQAGFEAFRDQHPERVSSIPCPTAPAPQLPGTIQAMQKAGRSDIDLFLTGTDALAAGVE